MLKRPRSQAHLNELYVQADRIAQQARYFTLISSTLRDVALVRRYKSFEGADHGADITLPLDGSRVRVRMFDLRRR